MTPIAPVWVAAQAGDPRDAARAIGNAGAAAAGAIARDSSNAANVPGYEGGYDAVRRYAGAWRRRRRSLPATQAFVPLSFDPGEAYQFDWSHEYAILSGTTSPVKAAHMRLAERIWGEARVASEWSSESWMRAQVRRWIPKARALAEGGWRDLVPRHVPEPWRDAPTVGPGV